MIIRYVFARLKPEFAAPSALSELLVRSRKLAQIECVRGLSVGAPADPAAAAAWDIGLAIRFDSLDDVELYLAHPEFEAFYQGYLEPRVHVIKTWNFVE